MAIYGDKNRYQQVFLSFNIYRRQRRIRLDFSHPFSWNLRLSLFFLDISFLKFILIQENFEKKSVRSKKDSRSHI